MSPEDGQATAAHELRGHRDNTREEQLQRMLSFKSRQRPNPFLGMMSLELRQHLLQGSQAAPHFRHGPSQHQQVHKHKVHKHKDRKHKDHKHKDHKHKDHKDEAQESRDDSETGEVGKHLVSELYE